ncbi:MAG: AlpA family transcriptional regulator [Alphaproteobacteria bacterium]|nr:AlpA family transcriptional regulator [Alphaproteobacteria bacterium]
MSESATRLLRLPEVLKRTGLGKTATYALMKDGTFPKPVSLTDTRVAWVESEIEEWLQQKIRDRGL